MSTLSSCTPASTDTTGLTTKTGLRLAICQVVQHWCMAQGCCTGSLPALHIQAFKMPWPSLLPITCSFKGICCAKHERHKHICRVAARVEAVVTRLQAIYRGARQRRAYLQDRQHVVRLQAAFRAFPARMQFLQAKGAAIWIQSCWRRYQAQQHVLRTRVCFVSLMLWFSTQTALEASKACI